MQEESDNIVYYSIVIACIVGILLSLFTILKNPSPQEEFTELYFHFEKLDTTEGREYREFNFKGFKFFVKNQKVWVDFNENGVIDEREGEFRKGDTLNLNGFFWNISDIAEDGSQILLGGYPKELRVGTQINFSFVISNRLGRDYTYTYEVYSNENLVLSEKVFVESGEKKKITVSFVIEEIGEVKVSVVLDTGEEIHFWLRVR
ncbi:MAG: hypothetical protein ACE5K0_00145 [Candidatus Methanofastidiosia archaeon]